MISLVYWNIHKSKNIEKSDPLLYKLNLQRLLTLYRNKNVCRLTGIMKKALLCMTARVLYMASCAKLGVGRFSKICAKTQI